MPFTFQGNEMSKKQIVLEAQHADFDLEGLKTDFPTAKDLERFVYDQTNVVLNLKGRSNDVKYATALAVLNGQEVDPKYLGGSNPYLEKADLVPEEPLRPVPERDSRLPLQTQMASSFFWQRIPHPDPSYRAQGKHVECQFRKYRNGAISYEVLGPIEPRPEGLKLDKYGKERPEIIRWVDPRTGEQQMRSAAGEYSEIGNRLRATMVKDGVWSWVDRDLVSTDRGMLRDVWGTENEGN